jgi:hypothetical protein
MELDQYVNALREQLAIAAETGGEEARSLALRLAAALDAAVRLTLLDALTAAAAEITRELAPGSVEVRLRGGDPDFAVIPPPAEPSGMPADDRAAVPVSGDGSVSRINLRLPDELKSQVEQAAERDGLSINAWLVRAAATAVDRGQGGPPRGQRAPQGGQSYTGWGR